MQFENLVGFILFPIQIFRERKKCLGKCGAYFNFKKEETTGRNILENRRKNPNSVIFFNFSCCCGLFLFMLGTLPCSTFGFHVGDELHGQSSDPKYFHIHNVCLRSSLLCIHMHKPLSLQHHVKQVQASFQGNLLYC